MIIAGIDYSLRSPCVCVFSSTEDESFAFEKCTFHFLTDTKKYATFFLKNIYGERFQDWDQDFQVSDNKFDDFPHFELRR